MSEFLNNIISRHTNPVGNIMPRLPGRFEPVNFPLQLTDQFAGMVNDTTPAVLTHENMQSGNGYNPDQAVDTRKSIANYNNAVHENIHPLNHTAEPLRQTSHTRRTSIADHNFPADEETGAENQFIKKIRTQDTSKNNTSIFNEPEAFNRNQFNVNKADGFTNHQEQPQPALIHKQEDIRKIDEDNHDVINEHDLKFKKKYRVPLHGKLDDVQNPKPLQAGLLKPSPENLNTGTNITFSRVLREQTTPPVIKVSIGRIEVRAVTPANPPNIKRDVPQKLNMSLDEYLKKRNSAEK